VRPTIRGDKKTNGKRKEIRRHQRCALAGNEKTKVQSASVGTVSSTYSAATRGKVGSGLDNSRGGQCWCPMKKGANWRKDAQGGGIKSA